MKKTNNTAKGIMCILFSALSFSGMSIFINMSGAVPVMQKVFFRTSAALVLAKTLLHLLLPLLLLQKVSNHLSRIRVVLNITFYAHRSAFPV